MRYSMLRTVKMYKNTFMCLVNNDRRRNKNKNAGTTFRLRLKYSDHLLVGALLKQLTTGTCRTRRQIKPITDAR